MKIVSASFQFIIFGWCGILKFSGPFKRLPVVQVYTKESKYMRCPEIWRKTPIIGVVSLASNRVFVFSFILIFFGKRNLIG